VSEFLKDKDVNFIVERKIATNITEATIKYALEVNADLISIMTEQDESLTSLVLGSYAQQMLNKSPIPVLSITPKEIFIMGSFSTQGKPY
jgi:nucleotide-binding universal stress UspA family protein